MFCGNLNGKEIQKRGDICIYIHMDIYMDIYICIHIADSLGCISETQHCKATVSQLKKKNIYMTSLVAQLVKNPPTMQGPQFNFWVRKFPWKRDGLPTLVFLGFPGGSDGKESACNAGDLGSIPGLGRSPGGGHGYPL